MKIVIENDCSLVNLSVDSFNLPSASPKGRTVTEDRVVLKEEDYWMHMVVNGNNILGNYYISSSGFPAYYEAKENTYYRVNFLNTIKQSFLLRINGTSLDLRYIMMRSAAPSKYTYSDEHYRIEFKNQSLEYPCSIDNLIVHEGFSLNFEWFMNEAVEWKWRCLKPELKQTKNKNKNSRVKKAASTAPQTKNRVKRAASTAPTPFPVNIQSKSKKQTAPAKKVKKASARTNPATTTPPAVKKVTAVKRTAPIMKKKVRLMSEKKFEALRFKMRLNITITKKERDAYKEQCVLRKLKRFLG